VKLISFLTSRGARLDRKKKGGSLRKRGSSQGFSFLYNLRKGKRRRAFTIRCVLRSKPGLQHGRGRKGAAGTCRTKKKLWKPRPQKGKPQSSGSWADDLHVLRRREKEERLAAFHRWERRQAFRLTRKEGTLLLLWGGREKLIALSVIFGGEGRGGVSITRSDQGGEEEGRSLFEKKGRGTFSMSSLSKRGGGVRGPAFLFCNEKRITSIDLCSTGERNSLEKKKRGKVSFFFSLPHWGRGVLHLIPLQPTEKGGRRSSSMNVASSFFALESERERMHHASPTEC